MIQLLQQHRLAIEQLCRRHGVAKLAVFGSAANGDFDNRSSDVDFMVEFDAADPDVYAEAYFALLFDLKKLLNRPIELVTERSIRNPYFREEVEETGQLLYAA